MGMEINTALLAALGGGNDSGIDPTGVYDRVNAMPIQQRRMIESYLDRTRSVPLPKQASLTDIGDTIAKMLEANMPELSETVRRKLANYYTYQWR
jgi:hypothetical protein